MLAIQNYDSDNDAGFQSTRGRRGGAGGAKKRFAEERITAYDIEEPEDDYATEVPEWPQHQRALPPIRAMLKFSFPAPKPVGVLKPEYAQKYKEGEEALEKAVQFTAAATAKVNAAEAALKTYTEEKVAVWGAASKRAEREAVVKRLQRELQDVVDAKKAAEAQMEKVIKANSTINSIVRLHGDQKETYKRHQEALFAYWDLTYGKHTPVCRAVDIWGRYEVRGEEKLPWGLTRFTLAPGQDVDRLGRECQMGGHEWVEVDGQEICLKTDTLAAYEPSN